MSQSSSSGPGPHATVRARGSSTGFSAAYADLEATLAGAHERGDPRVIAWGRSDTAALVFRSCAEHGDRLDAVLASSPGERFGGRHEMPGWASVVEAFLRREVP